MFADIDASSVPELVVINKADLADPLVLARLQRQEKQSIAVSARTGAGLTALLTRIAELVPSPEIEVTVLLPWSRGDLVARLHADGEVISSTHAENGTQVIARVEPALAAELEPFLVA